MTNIVLKYTIKEEQILREFLLENNISRKTLTRIKFDSDGSIKVNGREENVRYLLKKNDIVEITLPSENFSEFVRFINRDINITNSLITSKTFLFLLLCFLNINWLIFLFLIFNLSSSLLIFYHS